MAWLLGKIEKFACAGASWLDLLAPEFDKPYMKQLEAFLDEERASGTVVYPPPDLIFHAFNQAPFQRTRVAIIGQDPYHGEGQAHGLSFSVPKGAPPPPSLRNIFKELHSDLGVSMPSSGCLTHWADQGVLLLNATLTVRAGQARSHHGRGWEAFTDRVVHLLCERTTPMVFLLWGKSACDKFQHLRGNRGAPSRLVLTAPHPSPLSAHAGFFGCRHFSKTNDFLKEAGCDPIDWKIS